MVGKTLTVVAGVLSGAAGDIEDVSPAATV
jgi:hypothetical protein